MTNDRTLRYWMKCFRNLKKSIWGTQMGFARNRLHPRWEPSFYRNHTSKITTGLYSYFKKFSINFASVKKDPEQE